MNPYSIPSLPTDNLYKFYSISGIVIALFSITLILISSFNLLDDLYALRQTRSITKLEVEFLQDDILKYESRSEQLEKELSDFHVPDGDNKYTYEDFMSKLNDIRTDPEWRLYLEFIYKYEDNVFPDRVELREIEEIKTKISDSRRTLLLKNTKTGYLLDKIESDLNKLRVIVIMGSILTFFGLYLARKGFIKWKNQVQDLMDRKNEIEVLLLEDQLEKLKNK